MAIVDPKHGTKTAKVSILLLLLGLVLHVIGYCTAFWRSSGSQHEGLWERCVSDSCRLYYDSDTLRARVSIGIDGWFQAVEVLETIGLIFSVGAVMTAVLYGCVPPVSSRTTARCHLSLAILTGLCLMVGGIIYNSKANRYSLDLSWSFGLSMASCGLHYLAGLVLIPDVRRPRSEDTSFRE